MIFECQNYTNGYEWQWTITLHPHAAQELTSPVLRTIASRTCGRRQTDIFNLDKTDHQRTTTSDQSRPIRDTPQKIDPRTCVQHCIERWA